ncbi:MAG: acetyl-CoA carboxylase biotin carboxylase subunit [Acholeplasma sp.]|nr:acetyl-CoA carboxylase biotin carboxylase subunit [Acholeplasma sp.]
MQLVQNKLLVANRGEIAVRIIRACKELGIPTVAVYSLADQNSLHVQLADEAVCIGGNNAKDSYLNMNSILSAAIATGCNAIHPGYGFLAENEKFVKLVEEININFVGPSSEVIAKMSDKTKAKMIAKKNLIPIINGSGDVINDVNEGILIARKIGYPVMIKAANGGGGRGISVVYSDEEFFSVFDKTSMEADINFGNKAVFIERFIANPRHVEVQILADKHGNYIHLYERDCSLQRRNQKMLEEAPSNAVNDILRRKLGMAAIKLAKAVGYVNAGTVEFLVDENNKYYFIEMNTRVQVEHPVTEMITNVDIVKEQIKIAYGNKLTIKQRDVKILGHAIECRINAEDPINNFQPQVGKIHRILVPGGMGVRFDAMIYPDYEVVPFYDSLLGKLIVFAPTRKEAIRKMRVALEQLVIEGIKTNIEYQYMLVHHPEFIKGSYNTGFIAKFHALVLEEYYEETSE